MPRTLQWCTASTIAVLLSCQDYAFEEVRPITVISVTHAAKVDVTAKADILFVVDDSRSMAGEQQNLADNFSAFITQLNAFDPPVDYQIGVVTTSVHKRVGLSGGCTAAGDCNNCIPEVPLGTPNEYQCQAASCIQTYPVAGVLQYKPGRPLILKRSTPAILDAFSDNVKVGTEGSFIEQGLEAMRLAIQKAAPGGPNDGFLRDGSKLVVVIVSDEEDCSAPASFVQGTMSSTCNVFTDLCAGEARQSGGSLFGISEYVSLLRGMRNADGSARKVVVGVVADVDNTALDPSARCVNSDCFNACPAGPSGDLCRSDCGANGPGYRYDLFASAMGTGSVKASICSRSFSTTLESLARIIGLTQEVPLPAAANNPALFVVKVFRGTSVLDCQNGADYTYVPPAPPEPAKLVFQGACTLQPDDSYDIRFLTSG